MAIKASETYHRILILSKDHLKKLVPDEITLRKITPTEMDAIAAELGVAIQGTCDIEKLLVRILEYRGLAS